MLAGIPFYYSFKYSSHEIFKTNIPYLWYLQKSKQQKFKDSTNRNIAENLHFRFEVKKPSFL